VPLAGLIDVDLERTRLRRDLKKIEDDVVKLEAKLARRDFLDKARKRSLKRSRRNIRAVERRGNWPRRWSPFNDADNIFNRSGSSFRRPSKKTLGAAMSPPKPRLLSMSSHGRD